MEENMDTIVIDQLAQSLNLKSKRVQTVLSLLEDNTVPFIARYRKEMTGGMDEEAIREIDKAYQYQKQLKERKEDVIRLIDEKGMLEDALKAQIVAAKQLIEVEDLYRPYKEKKKTKATIAIKQGLEPLADKLLTFEQDLDPHQEAKAYLTEEITTEDQAIEGALFIIAERISDKADYRKWIRHFTFQQGEIEAKKKKNAIDDKNIYERYYAYSSLLKRVKMFHILALNRAEKEKVLSVKITCDEEAIHNYLTKQEVLNADAKVTPFIIEAIKDSYKRLIKPSIERELRSELTEEAENHAIDIFGENLRSLLLQAPLKDKIVLGIDPAFRTGCKLAVVDELGTLKAIDVIYPHPQKGGKPLNKDDYNKYKNKVIALIEKYDVEIIAIGNGTASRETEAFIVETIKHLNAKVYYTIVNEAGASVYSASTLAKKEFPKLQVEERSSVSIARRLQDPLSELVKIEPKSIGVGQYQHDVNQTKLSDRLDFTVETAVNNVGVNVNTASESLLNYVSGISKTIAKNIVQTREKMGAFTNRKQLLDVKGIGAKSYEQAIGFLRVLDGDNALDKTAIHPESYHIAEAILSSLNATLDTIGTQTLRDKLQGVKPQMFVDTLNAGLPTIEDILSALAQPLRDPRDDAPKPILKQDVLSLEDLKSGMKLKGTIRNVVDFGAFVDCGVKEDGLVHISKLKKGFVKHPLDVVKVGDVVDVWVVDTDLERARLQLSMVEPNQKN